ncbi:DUF3466 family protein [Idiomarina ramblicola]|uniref:DUF3466 domain-containing protein n=1 Tax=Idiomarina ramblicola TaxID=263724 RepID=A0A432Z594_9GAMM|nr:DUF3466 family protein [Idiomarina ramblicola]RUO72989.1 hypothetical protein CWI78_00675 [Idiomarina ramblicola]
MKSFTLKTLTVAIVSTISLSAVADKYQVEEIPTADNFRNSFAQDINAQEFIVGVSRLPTDVEIDLTKVSTNILRNAGITDVEEVETLTQEQREYITRQLANEANSNAQQQRVGVNGAYYFDTTTQSIEPFPANEDQLADSTDSYFYSINNQNSAVGFSSAPFSLIEYSYTDGDGEEQNREYFVSDFITRGVWYNNGETASITPPETEYLGGESALFDINESGLAAGYASIDVSPRAEERIASCAPEDEEVIVTTPFQVCAWNIWFELKTAGATNIEPYYNPYFGGSRSNFSARRSIYDIRGFLWQLDANGEVISGQELGTLEPRDEEDERDFSSYAFAVNNNDIAVGQSWTYHSQRGAIRMPAVFINGDAVAVSEEDKYFWGAANDINDNNVTVGYLVENLSGTLRNTGFIYDIDADELTPVPGFFTGSSTIVHSINNNGMAVGTGEIEATLSNVRQRVGFAYDSTDDAAEFINLNDAISCESPYNIVEANSINDNGVILATALKQEEYQDESGETQIREKSVTVKLDPVEGELNNCRQEENQVEREGASVGLSSLLTLGSLGLLITAIRRRAFLKTKKS